MTLAPLGDLLLSDELKLGFPLFRLLQFVGVDPAFHRNAGLTRDEDGGHIIRHIDDVALKVHAAHAVMDFTHDDTELLRHHDPYERSATTPLPASSVLLSVNSVKSMRRSAWPSLASGTVFIGCNARTAHLLMSSTSAGAPAE